MHTKGGSITNLLIWPCGNCRKLRDLDLSYNTTGGSDPGVASALLGNIYKGTTFKRRGKRRTHAIDIITITNTCSRQVFEPHQEGKRNIPVYDFTHAMIICTRTKTQESPPGRKTDQIEAYCYRSYNPREVGEEPL